MAETFLGRGGTEKEFSLLTRHFWNGISREESPAQKSSLRVCVYLWIATPDESRFKGGNDDFSIPKQASHSLTILMGLMGPASQFVNF